MSFRLVVLIVFAFHFSAQSQILKVHKGNIDTDSSKYFLGNIALNFNLNNQSGSAEENIHFRGLTTSADLVYVGKEHAYIMINNINYIKSTGGPLISNGYVHLRTNLLRKNKLSYEIFTQIQYDNGRNLSLRYLLGGGIRYRLIKREKSRLYYGLGLMQELEEWLPFEENASLIEKNITKVSTYLGGKVDLTETIELQVVMFYQSGYDLDSELYRNRVNGDVQLSIHVIGKLDFIVSFTAQYEDDPIIPVNNFVYALRNGLKWNF